MFGAVGVLSAIPFQEAAWFSGALYNVAVTTPTQIWDSYERGMGVDMATTYGQLYLLKHQYVNHAYMDNLKVLCASFKVTYHKGVPMPYKSFSWLSTHYQNKLLFEGETNLKLLQMEVIAFKTGLQVKYDALLKTVQKAGKKVQNWNYQDMTGHKLYTHILSTFMEKHDHMMPSWSSCSIIFLWYAFSSFPPWYFSRILR